MHEVLGSEDLLKLKALGCKSMLPYSPVDSYKKHVYHFRSNISELIVTC